MINPTFKLIKETVKETVVTNSLELAKFASYERVDLRSKLKSIFGP